MTRDPAASGPAPDAGHVDPDTLADLAEGLLAPAAADTVRDHLGTCDRCADDFAHISLDSGLAAFLPPEPIPADVTARVEAALYREPPLVDPAAGASAAQSARKAARVQRGRRFKLAFGVVGVLGLLGGGGVALSAVMRTASSEKVSTASGAGSASRADSLSRGSQNLAPNDELASARQQATQLLLALGSHGTAATTAKSGPSAGAGLNSEALKNPCWVNPRPTEKLLTYAPTTYQGQPAELLVYAKTDAPTQAHVVLVPTCALTTDSATAPGAPAAPGGGAFSSLTAARPSILAETDVTRP